MVFRDVNWFSDVRLTRVAEQLTGMVQVGVRFDTASCHDAEIAPGQSRFGGYPDLPEGFVWPEWKGRCLSFLAQFNMAELSSYSSMRDLPDAGWLCFFYDEMQSAWGFDPNDRGSSLVFYVPEGTEVKRHENESENRVGVPYRPCRVTPREVLTPMPWESMSIQNLRLSRDEMDAYWEACEQHESTGRQHQLLGHPSPIQGDMQLECQLVSNGLYCGGSSGYRGRRAKILREAAHDWRLLFQLDTDDDADMMWGDVGCLYFWMRDKDLRGRTFDRAWMILQCC